MWYRNNLSLMGKWSRTNFLFGLAVTAFIFGLTSPEALATARGNLSAHAHVSETEPTTQSTQLKLDLNSLNAVSKINDLTTPLSDLLNNALSGLKFNQNVNMSTGIPLSPTKSSSLNIDFNKFFSSSSVSSTDITSFLKEAAITGINLTLLIISITTQVLKGLLSVIRP